jgi:hypothetical protein
MFSSIGNLPAEILHKILSELPTKDSKHCRLVKHQWMHICNYYFLPDVYVSATEIVSRLCDIAQNKVVANHVRSINSAKTTLGNAMLNKCGEQALPPAQVIQVLPELGDTMENFKLLKTLSASDGRTFPWEPWVYSDTAVTESAGSCRHQLEVLQSGLARTDIHLTKLDAKFVDVRFFISKSIVHVWQHLTSLKLGVSSFHGLAEPEDPELGTKGLKQLLNELENLSLLHLSCAELNMPLASIIDEPHIRSGKALEKISDLSLQGFHSTKSLLLSLLDKPTLEKVSLGWIAIIDGNDGWCRAWQILRKCGLNQVSLSGYLIDMTADRGWDGDNTELFRQMEEWLVNESQIRDNEQECPFTEANMKEY